MTMKMLSAPILTLALPLLILFSMAWTVSSKPSTVPQLAGKWRLNIERSDNAREKLANALQSPPIAGERTSVGPNRDAREIERERTRRRIESLIDASEMLDIKQDAKVVTVSEGNVRERKLYTDGRPYQREDRRGNRTTVRARWQGERLLVDTRLADGGRFTETFELATDGQQLIVTFTSADRRLKQPLVIRRVYDAVLSD